MHCSAAAKRNESEIATKDGRIEDNAAKVILWNINVLPQRDAEVKRMLLLYRSPRFIIIGCTTFVAKVSLFGSLALVGEAIRDGRVARLPILGNYGLAHSESPPWFQVMPREFLA